MWLVIWTQNGHRNINSFTVEAEAREFAADVAGPEHVTDVSFGYFTEMAL